MRTLLVMVMFSSTAGASLSRKVYKLETELRDLVLTPKAPEVVLTKDSVVILDGKKVEYKDVPADAVIKEVVLAKDGRTIIRIEFSTPKKPKE